MTDFDAIIIGGGHNGLICASYLAKSGKRVAVVEAKSQVGGAAATEAFAEGFQVSRCAQWVHQLSPTVQQDLRLAQHGLSYAAENLGTISLRQEGEHLRLEGDQVSGADVGAEDQEAYRLFRRKMLKYAKLMHKLYSTRPPKLVEHDLQDKILLAKLGLGMKMLGRDDMSDLMRLILINIFDVMNETFASPALRAAIALDAVQGTPMGPRSPNTVFTYLHRFLGNAMGFEGVSQVKGGLGGLGNALASAAQSLGVEVKVDAAVARIDKTHDVVTGVTLASGESLTAKVVVSSADPKTTFKSLLGYAQMEAGMVRRVEHIRFKSGTAKVHLALRGLPEFRGLNEKDLGQRLIIAPSMQAIENAFNPLKYDECSEHPVMDISVASVNDPSLVAGGGHVLSAIVQYAPFSPKGGWSAMRDSFIKRVIDELSIYAPGIEDLITASELLTPADLEQQFGMTGGNWHHGELTMDQVLMTRPATGISQYATNIDGLFLCGAGAHPGGNIMGLAGKNAAEEIIRQGVLA